MKIAISAVGKEKHSLMDPRFGRCEYFHIYDNKSNDYYIIENNGLNSSGGAGIAAAQQLLDEKIETIITGSLGPNAYNIIEKAKIKAYKGDNCRIVDLLEQLNKNQLLEITGAGESHKGITK